ncbi:hypothetical protein QPK24_04660 [Paenibacillus polygoni]|uniref:Uncharacterized protein n=1 Tax=Paenibacillus polygoni TaxID=3050112 RepID=A0ABY8X4N5_9BACL|nr:hypothetical protein [Paenibacillus polygoni]WIV20013.1 hypothetical protein QPK24_04660 [Paenibacillus polygoni]
MIKRNNAEGFILSTPWTLMPPIFKNLIANRRKKNKIVNRLIEDPGCKPKQEQEARLLQKSRKKTYKTLRVQMPITPEWNGG